MINDINSREIKPKRVVVIGSNGFIGSGVVKKLKREKVETVALSRVDVDLLEPFAWKSLLEIFKPTDSVVAAAAVAPVKELKDLKDNIIIMENLSKAVKESKVNYLVNVGSDAVFGDDEKILNESSSKSPGSLHGLMHLMREQVFDALDCSVGTIRPTLVYGKNDPHDGYGPNKFARQIKKGKAIHVFGEGEELRDHIYVEDVISIIIQMLYRKSVGSVNAVTGEVFSFREIAELLQTIIGKKVGISSVPRKSEMPHQGFRKFNNELLVSHFKKVKLTKISKGLRSLKNIRERRSVGN